MSLVPLTSVIPPGGHHFIDRSVADAPRRFDGSSFEDLAQQVLKYRLDNKLPPGDPAREIVDYVCGNWPQACKETKPPAVQPRPGGELRGGLATRVAAWIAALYRNVPSVRDPSVHPSVSQARADICVNCPHNVDYKSGGCGSCLDSIERVGFVLRRDRQVANGTRLQGCRATGQHNPTAIWFSDEVLPPLSEQARGLIPKECWRKVSL